MKTLILDFLRRWWWLFAISLLLSAGSGIGGVPFVFAPAAVIALLLDAQRGVFRVVRPLPVPRAEQAKAWWFVGVPLLPLLTAPVLAIAVFCSQFVSPSAHRASMEVPPSVAVMPELSLEKAAAPAAAPMPDRRAPLPSTAPKTAAQWFAAGVQIWVALGYAGFCFFLIQWAPTRPPENLAENVQQGLFGALWGISMPACAFLLPNLPKTPEAVAPWHWAVFIAAPVFVAFSYFSAAELVQRRMFVSTVKAKREPEADRKILSSGLEGIPLYLANFAGRVLMFVVAMAAVQLVVFRWTLHGSAPANNPALGMQVSLMGIMIGAVTAESIGTRALRVLPISTRKLALLLALIPWAGAFASAVFSAVWCRAGDPALSVLANLVAQSLALCGWATLAFAVQMHIASSARLFVLMLLVTIPGVVIPFFATHTNIFATLGTLSGVAGFALLVRGVKKSAAFYRPRGLFGMTPGQPSAVR